MAFKVSKQGFIGTALPVAIGTKTSPKPKVTLKIIKQQLSVNTC